MNGVLLSRREKSGEVRRQEGNQQKQLRLMVSKAAGKVGNHINTASAANALS